MNRSIFRSNKNMQGETEGKRVQVVIASQHLLETEEDAADKENSQKCIGKREASNSANRKTKKIKDGKMSATQKSLSVTKGCLKRDSEERALSEAEDMDAKSTRSIKFKDNPSDVF